MRPGIEGLQATLHKLKSQQKKYGNGKDENVVVGFAQTYSVYVHEDLEAHHTVGNAQFLMRAIRSNKPLIKSVIVAALQRGRSFLQAMLQAGTVIRKAAQAQTPVDTGSLKMSAYVCRQERVPEVAAAAYAKAEAHRIATLAARKGGGQ